MLLYVIEFDNGKRYIGVTQLSLSERLRGGYGGMVVGRARKRHGYTARVILTGPRHLILLMEQHFIELWGTKVPHGYNVADGGCHTLQTPAKRARTSQMMTNLWADPDRAEKTKQKMRAAWTPERREAQGARARIQVGLEKAVVAWSKTNKGRAACSTRMKKYWSNPENREAQAERARRQHARTKG